MRCNVGVNPKYLLDQWLIAEYRELPMVVGSLRVNGWKIKSEVKEKFDLGKGHINFLKSRLMYLSNRHDAVKIEMEKRRFKCDVLRIDMPDTVGYWNDWKPTMEDSMKIRGRLKEKLTINKLPITWWRWNRQNMTPEFRDEYISIIQNSELFYV
jgi:deoxyribonuclease (pyrimidine dimer)